MFFWFLCALTASFTHAADFDTLKTNDVEVVFPPALSRAAEETSRITPEIKRALYETFQWSFHFRPTVILVEDPQLFQKMTQNSLVVGFAVPEKDLVVLDFARIRDPIKFQDILKHELCHLLIHKYVNRVDIPRWFDEGIAQWASNGMMDIVHDQKDALLPKAAFSDRIMPLGALNKGFPGDPNGLRLAYEEGRSVIDFIIGAHGKAGLLEILGLMKEGMPFRKAVIQVSGSPLYEIEAQWRASLKQSIAWFAHLSYYLYEILFALGGLIVVYAFIKTVRKKKAYMEEE